MRHYENGNSAFTAADIMNISETLSRGNRAENGDKIIYSYNHSNGTEYTVVAEKDKGKENFVTFYTSRKASDSGVSYTQLSAHASLSDASDAANVGRNSKTASDEGELFRSVENPETIARLEKEPTFKAYRAMQVIDGKLYSPMAAKVDGKLASENPFDVWTEAEETAFDFTEEQKKAMEELDNSGKPGSVEIIKGKLRYYKGSKNGKGALQFHLVKGDGTDLWAAYNPYIHSSLMMLNDQFTSAYKRPNIVVVEVEIPAGELTAGYKAEKAKDSVGMANWKSGPVAGQLPGDMGRKVMLSRWSKVVRIVPYSEVADHVAGILQAAEAKKGEKISLPIDSFHPELRKELEKRGFNFVEGDYTKGTTNRKGEVKKPWDAWSEAEKEKAYHGARYIDDAAIADLNGKLGGEWIQREGNAVDSAPSLNEAAHLEAEARKLAELLHLDNIDFVPDGSAFEGKKARAKGWYSRSTGRITVVVGNHASVGDIMQTVLHEAVAHYGLRKMFGEHFDNFLDNVYNNADGKVREAIDALAGQYNGNIRTATEEYLASLAENTNFEEVKGSSWWQSVKKFFMDMLCALGFDYNGPALGDNELRYILWRSFENLRNPGPRGIFAEAEDIAKQSGLKVGNYAEKQNGSATEDLFRDGDLPDYEKALARDKYERAIKKGVFQMREALQDSMLSLREAMLDIVQAETGKRGHIEDIAGFENAYLGENRLSSQNSAEMQQFAQDVFAPMLEEVANLAKTADA